MSDIEILLNEQSLKQLILDDDFTSIQRLVNEEVNLMSILKVDHRELPHSNLLAWLFDPVETHGLGDYFIKEFIKLYFKENEYQDLGNVSSKLSVFDFVDFDFSDLEVKREHRNIDILMMSKLSKLCIMIENKIYSKEANGQLERYRNYVEKELDFEHKIYIYLSLFEQDISESEADHYVQLTYDHIRKLLTQALKDQSISMGNNTNFVLKQYLQTLESLMNENQEIEKIAKNLYKKYKSAFDLVYKYAKPNLSAPVPNSLVELIEKNETLKPFDSSRSYVRFQPRFLYENIEKLKENGFLSKDDDLNESWLFLFEFHVTREAINFDLKIGQYTDQACRKKLYELFKANKNVFTKVVKRNGNFSPTWHLAFQKKIVEKSAYENYLENDGNSLDDLIEERFKDLMENDLPKIQEVIEKAIF